MDGFDIDENDPISFDDLGKIYKSISRQRILSNVNVQCPNVHFHAHPGGFQLEFVSISRVINHMTYYNSSALIGGKFIITKKSFKSFSLQSECCNFNQ